MGGSIVGRRHRARVPERREAPTLNSSDGQVGVPSTLTMKRGPKGGHDHFGPSDLANRFNLPNPDLTVAAIG